MRRSALPRREHKISRIIRSDDVKLRLAVYILIAALAYGRRYPFLSPALSGGSSGSEGEPGRVAGGHVNTLIGRQTLLLMRAKQRQCRLFPTENTDQACRALDVRGPKNKNHNLVKDVGLECAAMHVNLPLIIRIPRSSLPDVPMGAAFAASNEVRDAPEQVFGGVGPRSRPGPIGKLVPNAGWAQEFWVPHRGEIIRIGAKEIDVITAERDYVRLHVGAASFLLHRTLRGFESQLDPADFLRLHRSMIVRSDFIAGFKYTAKGSWSARLRDGSWQPVGRTYLANVRAIAGR